MKAFFIGDIEGVCKSVLRRLALDPKWEIYLLNNKDRADGTIPHGFHQIIADIDNYEEFSETINDIQFDVVCDFNAQDINKVERDYRIFGNKTKQYLFISSAYVYSKSLTDYRITEETALKDKHNGYLKEMIECEAFLMKKYYDTGFPVTIVRPGQFYDEKSIPVSLCGNNGFYQVIRRMQQGRPVIIHGDGTSLWSLTFIDDLAIGLVGLMDNQNAIGEVYNIAGDEVLTWNRIYETIAEALNVELNVCHITSDFLRRVGMFCGYDLTESLLDEKAGSVVFDNTKVKRLVPEMKTNIPFSEGVRVALDHILSHTDEYEEDPMFDKFCDKITDALEETWTRLTISLYGQIDTI